MTGLLFFRENLNYGPARVDPHRVTQAMRDKPLTVLFERQRQAGVVLGHCQRNRFRCRQERREKPGKQGETNEGHPSHIDVIHLGTRQPMWTLRLTAFRFLPSLLREQFAAVPKSGDSAL